MSLRSVNLNLIPVLRVLLRERNLSRAAREVHLTQPAVSAALARLRVALKDPLLVQVGRRMELTARARALIEPVEQACAALDRVLLPVSFEPQASLRRFVISTSDYAPTILAPPMIQVLAREAPGVSMHFVNQSLDSIEAHRPSEVDLMFVPRSLLDVLLPHKLQTLHVLHEQFVYAVGPGHGLYQARRPTPKQLAEQQQVRLQPARLPSSIAKLGSLGTLAERVGVPASGESRRRDGRLLDVALVEQFNMLPLIALLSSSMTLAPRRLVEALQPYMPLRIIDAGLDPIDMCIAWESVHEHDPAHRWFRELVRDTVGDSRFAAHAVKSSRKTPRA